MALLPGHASHSAGDGTCQVGNHHHTIPNIPRTKDKDGIPNGWRTAVRQWQEPDPPGSGGTLTIALKDWDPVWYSGSDLAMQYRKRRVVAEEYIR